MERWLAGVLTAGAIAWSGAILFAPLAHRHTPAAMTASLVYAGAARICHQRPDRSFYVAGRQMPVCARCSGLYLSGAAGALLAFLGSGRVRVPRSTRTVLIVTSIPTVLTLALEIAGLAYPSALVRALSALPLGGACGWIFVRLLRAKDHVG